MCSAIVMADFQKDFRKLSKHPVKSPCLLFHVFRWHYLLSKLGANELQSSILKAKSVPVSCLKWPGTACKCLEPLNTFPGPVFTQHQAGHEIAIVSQCPGTSFSMCDRKLRTAMVLISVYWQIWEPGACVSSPLTERYWASSVCPSWTWCQWYYKATTGDTLLPQLSAVIKQ